MDSLTAPSSSAGGMASKETVEETQVLLQKSLIHPQFGLQIWINDTHEQILF